MSRYAQRALAVAATLPRGKLLASAADVKAVAGAYAIAHPEPKDATPVHATLVNVAILLDGCPLPGGEERTLDVTAETVIEGE